VGALVTGTVRRTGCALRNLDKEGSTIGGVVGRLAIVLVAAAAAAGAARTTTAAPTAFILHGSVAPGHITLRNGLGQPYLHGRRGLYRISITDTSPTDDFHLIGPGVNTVITSSAFVGAHAVQLTLEPGTYHYVSDAHRAVMKGSFIVV
jgi:hypothetical protein